MTLYYINSENCSVFEAQVLSLINFFNKSGYFSKVVLLQGYRNKYEKSVLEKKIGKCSFEVRWFKTWPSYNGFTFLISQSIERCICSQFIFEDDVFHIRGEIYGSIVSKLFKAKKIKAQILVDFRGVVIEETQIYLRRHVFLKYLKIQFLKKCYKQLMNDVKISVVSEYFKSYLIDKYNFKDHLICVNPNIANTDFVYCKKNRKMTRKELLINENDIVVVCSSNGNNSWQKDFEFIQTLVSNGFKVINLTGKKVDLDGVITSRVPFSSMPNYLCAADYALLWREDNIVNKVASPSKYSEFAAMGLKTIHNGTIDLVTRFIVDNDSGFIVNSWCESTIELLKKGINYDREALCRKGFEIFSIESISKNYFQQYIN